MKLLKFGLILFIERLISTAIYQHRQYFMKQFCNIKNILKCLFLAYKINTILNSEYSTHKGIGWVMLKP